ncbi:MAG: ESPR domain-containing protein [Methylobacillus sp.]|nr:ESPR domain-containing protein [Methylobacillus sp.]
MNRSYKNVFNRRLGVWQAVSEAAKTCGKPSRGALSGVTRLPPPPATIYCTMRQTGNGDCIRGFGDDGAAHGHIRAG